MEAVISHGFPPADTWYNLTPELTVFGVTVTVNVEGDVDSIEIPCGTKLEW